MSDGVSTRPLPEDEITQPWIRIYQEKILSSLNLRKLSFSEHSVYLQFYLRIRPAGKYMGMIVYPNGKAVPDDEIAKDMKLKLFLFQKHKKALLKVGVIKIINGAIYIRKYRELGKKKGESTKGLPEELPPEPKPGVEQHRNNTGTTPEQQRINLEPAPDQPDSQVTENKGLDVSEIDHKSKNRIDKEGYPLLDYKDMAMEEVARDIFKAHSVQTDDPPKWDYSKILNFINKHKGSATPLGSFMTNPKYKGWELKEKLDEFLNLKKSTAEVAKKKPACKACGGKGLDMTQPKSEPKMMRVGGKEWVVPGSYPECPVCKGEQ